MSSFHHFRPDVDWTSRHGQRQSTRFVLCKQKTDNEQHLGSEAIILLPCCISLSGRSRKLSTQQHVAALKKDIRTTELYVFFILLTESATANSRYDDLRPGYLSQPLSGSTRSNTNTQSQAVCVCFTKAIYSIEKFNSLLSYSLAFGGETQSLLIIIIISIRMSLSGIGVDIEKIMLFIFNIFIYLR